MQRRTHDVTTVILIWYGNGTWGSGRFGHPPSGTIDEGIPSIARDGKLKSDIVEKKELSLIGE